jgi:hypothetical protein
MKGKKIYLGGTVIEVDTKEFEMGDGEGMGVAGYYENGEDGRTIVVDTKHLDDSTFAHELGHQVCETTGVYMSEYQMAAWEMFFVMCRDPRNKWLKQYYFGDA